MTPSHRDESGKAVGIFLSGDVMTGRGIDQVLPHPSDPSLYEPYVADAREYVRLAEDRNGGIPCPVLFPYVWGDAMREWRRHDPDVRIVNLETAVTVSTAYEEKGINYHMHPENIPVLSEAGIDCAVLANNHVLDWGPVGLVETLEALHGAGIETAGAGRNETEARRPAILDCGEKGRVLVFSYGHPSSGIPSGWAAGRERPGIVILPDLSMQSVMRVKKAVAAVKQPKDIALFSIHWGGNWGYEVSGAERSFAHNLIDGALVDIVHGHSSHHVKGIELYRGKPIFYGCGDFLDDYEGIAGYESFRADLSLMYFLSMDSREKTLTSLAMTPLRVRRFRLEYAMPADVEWLSDTLNREGERFGTRFELVSRHSLALTSLRG